MSRTNGQRVDREEELVDEIILHERLQNSSAAEQHQIPRQLLIKLCNRPRDIARDERGVFPR